MIWWTEAYLASIIKNKSLELGHVPLIDINYQRDTVLKQEIEADSSRLDLSNEELPEVVRYHVWAHLNESMVGIGKNLEVAIVVFDAMPRFSVIE